MRQIVLPHLRNLYRLYYLKVRHIFPENEANAFAVQPGSCEYREWGLLRIHCQVDRP